MKNLKSILGVGLMFLALSGIAQQKEGHSMSKDPAERAKKQTEKMTEHLSLDAEQQRKIADINLRYATRAQTIHDGSEDQEAAKMEIKKLKRSQDTEIKAVLNEKQNAIWEEHKQKRKEQRQQKQPEKVAPTETK